MQVNYARKLKYVADRPNLDRLLAPVIAGRELTYKVIDSPVVGALGLPRWSSVSFTAHHGSHPALVAEVGYAIEQAGLADRFESAT